MSPLHLYLDLDRLALIQDEFKIEVRRPCLAAAADSPSSFATYLSRSASISSSCRSEGQSSNFSFSAAYKPAGGHEQAGHCQTQSAYADEIFLNGKIRPLHDQLQFSIVEATALYADSFHSETLVQVHIDEGPHPAAASPSLTVIAPCCTSHHRAEPERAASNPLCQNSELARTSVAKKVASRKPLSILLPLRKVFHAEDECSSPSSKTQLLKEPPHRTKVSSLEGQACNGHSYLKKATTFVHNSPSNHALHYNAQRALSYNPRRALKENTSKRTSLPYRRGILACIGY
ncbi:hypothetical protein GOP47_0006819 [Adiantum capillus-veneris]|uniref:Uncharacterized protein n=1 Tax=Adiantum capillus-veneris TaxID=13818 RepID=A0A9D4ZKM3_ADICA|nr:hypothetical protein GOP47_0006819 [Adiantum capillus-veneris]